MSTDSKQQVATGGLDRRAERSRALPVCLYPNTAMGCRGPGPEEQG